MGYNRKLKCGGKAIHEGVAFVTDKTWRNYILDVEPVSEGIMVLKLRGSPADGNAIGRSSPGQVSGNKSLTGYTAGTG